MSREGRKTNGRNSEREIHGTRFLLVTPCSPRYAVASRDECRAVEPLFAACTRSSSYQSLWLVLDHRHTIYYIVKRSVVGLKVLKRIF